MPRSRKYKAADLEESARASYLSEMLGEIPERIVDPGAVTVSELVKAKGFSRFTIDKLIAKKLAARKWEKVFKRNGNSIVPAYRPIKKRS